MLEQEHTLQDQEQDLVDQEHTLQDQEPTLRDQEPILLEQEQALLDQECILLDQEQASLDQECIPRDQEQEYPPAQDTEDQVHTSVEVNMKITLEHTSRTTQEPTFTILLETPEVFTPGRVLTEVNTLDHTLVEELT